MNEGHIVKQGPLRRLKTQKRRYFVLRSPSNGTARLEYFENERRFRLQSSPRRVINLASCFNITRKEDPKNRFVFALCTRDDVFGLIADSDEDMDSWLRCLREERNKSEKRSDYVSMWHVMVKPRGLGTSKNLVGQYDLKLANQSITFMKRETNKAVKEIKLVNIRRCGHTDCFFFMELGRSAITGAGELWMQVDDQVIAQNMHEAILSTMQNLSMTDLSLQARLRTGGGARGGGRNGRGRPSSALILPANRTRAESMPDSPTSRRRAVSSSTNRHSSSSGSSPKIGKPNMFSRFRPKRRLREENWPSPIPRRLQSKSLSIDAGLHGEYLGKAHSVLDFSMLTSLGSPTNGLASPGVDLTKSCDSLISPSPPSTVLACNTRNGVLPSPTVEQRARDYVNSTPGEIDRSDYYMKMAGSAAKTSKRVPEGSHYMDMEQGCRNGKGEVTKFEPVRGTQSEESCPTNQDIPDETSTNTSEVNQTNSSSPKQLRTSELRASGLRELVNIKSSPKSSPGLTRRVLSQDYITMAPGALRSTEEHCYVNFSPGAQPEAGDAGCGGPCYMNVCPGESLGSPDSDSVFERSYVNFDPSQQVNSDPSKQLNFDQVDSSSCYQNGAQTYVNFVPGQSMGDEEPSPDCLESRCYVNFNPGKALSEESRLASDVRRMKIKESPPRSPTREYMNLDFSKDSPNLTADAAVHPNEEREYMNFQPGKPNENTPPLPRFKVSPHGKRRESEPANLHRNNSENLCVDDDDHETPLNYVMLDLGKQIPAGSPKRQRPSDINLRGCNSTACGPKSAPPYKSYVEIDFTKSQGLRQARLKGRESAP